MHLRRLYVNHKGIYLYRYINSHTRHCFLLFKETILTLFEGFNIYRRWIFHHQKKFCELLTWCYNRHPTIYLERFFKFDAFDVPTDSISQTFDPTQVFFDCFIFTEYTRIIFVEVFMTKVSPQVMSSYCFPSSMKSSRGYTEVTREC